MHNFSLKTTIFFRSEQFPKLVGVEIVINLGGQEASLHFTKKKRFNILYCIISRMKEEK